MSIAREDYIQRQISLLAEAIRRLRGMMGDGAPIEEIIAGIRSAEVDLLGPRAQVVRVLDAATAARLVNSPEAVRQWVQLLGVEAEAYRQAGAVAQAGMVEERAAGLLLAADSAP